MNEFPLETTARKRGQFLLLAALFFVPLIAAVVLYFGFPQWQPKGRTNYGELVAPAKPLPIMQFTDLSGAPRDTSVFNGHWSYVYMAGAQCNEACVAKIIQIRQTRTLLNEKRARVQRIYIAPDAAALEAAHQQFGAEQPDLLYLAEAGPAGQRATDFFKPTDAQALYLVDPHGNWLMVYPSTAEYQGILKDIKLLLKLSQIG
jgi:cytochrome oxidase Cu insertion factor (SCO1/SenC/PrrC family)